MIKEKLKGKKKFVVAAVCGALLLSAIFGVASGGTAVKALIVAKESFTEKIVAIGQLGLQQETTLIAEVNGDIQSVTVGEGESISAGTLFIEIENQASLEYASAKSEYDRLSSLISYSGTAYNNALVLYNEGAISKVEMQDRKFEYESALSQYAAAKLKLEQASNNISKYQVTVPWDAVVLKTYVSAGDYVQSGNPLADIGSAEGFSISAELDEKYFPYIRKGLPVMISVGDGSMGASAGEIQSITPKINENTGTFEIGVSLPESYAYQVSNLTVNLEIVTRELQNAISIPKSYLWEQADANNAYVLLYKSGIAVKQPVKIQPGLSSEIVVTDGLAEGDVVLSPADGLQDGDAVKKYEEASAS